MPWPTILSNLLAAWLNTSPQLDDHPDHHNDLAVAVNTLESELQYLAQCVHALAGGNVGIGTVAPNASALLDLTSITRGFAPPRMTTVQRDAIGAPIAGLFVYNTTTKRLEYYNGSTWTDVITWMAATGGRLHIPNSYQDWTAVLTGTGSNASNFREIFVAHNLTANSTARVYTLWEHLTRSGAADWTRFDMSTPWEIGFNLAKEYSDAETVAYVQFKTATTHGDLAAIGLGVRLNNTTLLGESYGAARGTVAMGSVTLSRSHKIGIRLTPGVKVEFYLDGALVGTQTTAANVPNAVFPSAGYILASIANGATGGDHGNLHANGFTIFVQQ